MEKEIEEIEVRIAEIIGIIAQSPVASQQREWLVGFGKLFQV